MSTMNLDGSPGIPGSRNCLCMAHARKEGGGGGGRLADRGVCIFVTFAQSISESTIIVICMIYDLRSARD